MFIGEGTKAGLFQSIMPKPPNIAPVYPLMSESNTTIITAGRKPLIVFNPELNDPSSLMHLSGNSKYYKVLKTLSTYDVDVAILATPKTQEKVHRSLKSIPFANPVKVYETTNVFDVNLEGPEDADVFWLSSCTQANFLAAIEKFKAPIIGYANELSHTQVFNCHKLYKYNVGTVYEDFDDGII